MAINSSLLGAALGKKIKNDLSKNYPLTDI
jgi:hypothetical protein